MSFALYQRYLGMSDAELDQLEVMDISNDATVLIHFAARLSDTKGESVDVLDLYNRLQDYLHERQRQSVNALVKLLEPTDIPDNVVSLRP